MPCLEKLGVRNLLNNRNFQSQLAICFVLTFGVIPTVVYFSFPFLILLGSKSLRLVIKEMQRYNRFCSPLLVVLKLLASLVCRMACCFTRTEFF